MSRQIILDGKYTLINGSGQVWAESHERGVQEGDTRVISYVLMYAYQVHNQGLFVSSIVDWRPVDRDLAKDDKKKLQWALGQYP